MTMLLTGCKTVDKIVAEINQKSEEYKEEKEEKARQKDRDTLTSKEYDDIKDDLYSEAHGIRKGWNKVCSFFTGESESTRWARKNKNQMNDRIHRAANDKVLQEQEEDKKEMGSFLSRSTKYLPLVVILAVIVLLVVLFIFLSKRSVSKPVRVVSAPTRAPAPAPVQQSNQVDVKYAKVLRDNCDKLGLDYDATLARYGGDLVTAVNETNLQIYRQ